MRAPAGMPRKTPVVEQAHCKPRTGPGATTRTSANAGENRQNLPPRQDDMLPRRQRTWQKRIVFALPRSQRAKKAPRKAHVPGGQRTLSPFRERLDAMTLACGRTQ